VKKVKDQDHAIQDQVHIFWFSHQAKTTVLTDSIDTSTDSIDTNSSGERREIRQHCRNVPKLVENRGEQL